MTALRPSIFDNYNSGSHIDGPSFIQGADSQLTQMKNTNMESSKQRSVFDNPFTNKGKQEKWANNDSTLASILAAINSQRES